MFTLGIHHGHDSSAALLRDGQIVADVAEERFTRIKHYCGLPFKAVEYCLKSAGIGPEEIDVVSIASELQRPDINHLLRFPAGKEQRASLQRRGLHAIRSLRGFAPPCPPIYLPPYPLKKSVEVFNVNHHLAHAASAYFTSGNSDAQLVATMDGSGDGISTALWRAGNGKIELLDQWGFGSSLGIFYSLVTEALGWWHGDGEGKTMGLAPYGDPEQAYDALKPYVPRYCNGSLLKAVDFGQPRTWAESGAMHFHLRDAEAVRGIVQKYGRENVAAAAQRHLEEQVFELVLPRLEREKHRNFSAAGGLFLNVKLNQRLWETGKITNHWNYPNAGDSGLAAGAALYAWNQYFPGGSMESLPHLYHGPEFSNAEIEAALKLRKLSYRFLDNPALETARLLAQNQIVAWFQGRMESGPRALGNRSILMSANRAENKDIINARVKFREGFRPFCPSLCDEAKADYLENCRSERFMITSFTCREEKRGCIPAVVHEDFTLRPQTVEQEANPLYHELLSEFGKLTGEPLLLNTSLNIMGEPMICTPAQAIRCFFDSGLDAIVMGSYLVQK